MNGVLASIVGIALGLAIFPSASHAAIVETIIDSDTDATVGSITFPTLTGSSDAGVLFSFAGFTQTDITSISWGLDPSTLDVVSLDLDALQGTPGCGFGQNCSNRTLNLSPTLAQQSSITCNSSDGHSGCGTGFTPNESISFVPTAVPEPSTWAMMLLGFAGLGIAAYRTVPGLGHRSRRT
jgi:hypothetical protein